MDSRKEYWEAAKASDPRFVRRLLLHQLGSANKFVGFTLATKFAPLGEPVGSWMLPARGNFTTLQFDVERYEIVLQV